MLGLHFAYSTSPNEGMEISMVSYSANQMYSLDDHWAKAKPDEQTICVWYIS